MRNTLGVHRFCSVIYDDNLVVIVGCPPREQTAANIGITVSYGQMVRQENDRRQQLGWT